MIVVQLFQIYMGELMICGNLLKLILGIPSQLDLEEFGH